MLPSLRWDKTYCASPGDIELAVSADDRSAKHKLTLPSQTMPNPPKSPAKAIPDPQPPTQALQFYIFGNNISHSLSPTIHNAAFAHLRLPHHYSIHETPDISATIRSLIASPTFGGASVTFPHKLAVQPLCDSIADTAARIGAVNTLVVRHSHGRRSLHGENSDWLGIRNCIRRHAFPKGMPTSAVVVGAGGAARAAVFAIHALGVEDVALVNRSAARAERLIHAFPEIRFTLHASLAEVPRPVDLIVSCVPADDIVEEDIPSHVFAPAGCVVEMSYRPPVSALMRVAGRMEGWSVFGGVDVLKEQAYVQFHGWTGLEAPVDVIERALDAGK
jgi:shikimate-5-dehydrogenase